MNTTTKNTLAGLLLALALAGTGQAADIAAELEQLRQERVQQAAEVLLLLQELAADLEELTPEQRQELERRITAKPVQDVRELLQELGAADRQSVP